MNYRYKILAVLLFTGLGNVALNGQVQWQLGVYTQYEYDVGSRALQLQGLNPGAKLGARLDVPGGVVNFYLTGRWERLREDSIEIYWFNFGTQESLKHDNLVVGPGLEMVFFSRRKLHVLLGLEVFLGIPLRTNYELFGPKVSSTHNFPLHMTVDGGALYMAGWQTYAGFEGRITDQQLWQLRIGMGNSAQYYDWGNEIDFANDGLLHGGRYAFGSLGIVHTFHKKARNR